MSNTCSRPGCDNPAKALYCSHRCANDHIAQRKRDGVAVRVNGAAQTLSRTVKESNNGGSRELTIPVNHEITNEQEMVEVCNIDTEKWEVDHWLCNTWTGHMAPRVTGSTREGWSRSNAEPVKTRQWQVKVWLKKRMLKLAVENEIAQLRQLAKRALSAPRLPSPSSTTGLLLEINIADLHVGKLAWEGETGDENYDSRIAERLHDDALATILRRAGVPQTKYERILLIVGNDLLHSDTKAGTTTKGTQLDNDGRYHKTFARTRTMIIRAITQLRQYAPVTALVAPGNHDTLSTWHLGDSLEAYFHADAAVEVRNEPTPRKYFEFGKVMLMFTHGDKGKLSDFPLVMATEQPEMWARTQFREIHTGDKHQERLIENRGVKARILPSLSAPDAWHNENFFTGNLRQAQAFIWAREEGLIGTISYTAPKEAKDEKVDRSGFRGRRGDRITIPVKPTVPSQLRVSPGLLRRRTKRR
jgi:hypothetical protein